MVTSSACIVCQDQKVRKISKALRTQDRDSPSLCSMEWWAPPKVLQSQELVKYSLTVPSSAKVYHSSSSIPPNTTSGWWTQEEVPFQRAIYGLIQTLNLNFGTLALLILEYMMYLLVLTLCRSRGVIRGRLWWLDIRRAPQLQHMEWLNSPTSSIKKWISLSPWHLQ